VTAITATAGAPPVRDFGSKIWGSQICADVDGLAGGAHREWLLPDGAGGFAMGTASGLRTRRYHALLVVPDATTGERRVGLVSLDAVVSLSGGPTIALSTHEWAARVTAPTGHHHLEAFELVEGLPCWRWRIGDLVLERELAMASGRPSLAVVHRLVSAPAPVRVDLTAMCTWRPAGDSRGASGPPPSVTPVSDGAVIDNAYRLAGAGWRSRGEWWYGAYTRADGGTEDLWRAGSFTATLEPGEVMEVSAWAGDLRRRPHRATAVLGAARRRARAVVVAAKPTDSVDATLALAADAFIVKGPDVVAGYPWQAPRARDTLTSYEGLFLHTGRAAEGAALLRRQAGELGEPAGQSDAPLWLVHAVDRHVTATGDTHLGADLLSTLEAVLDGYVASDRPWSARVDPDDGLLALRVDEAASTWMNGVADGGPLTPRDGKPVDLNALWVNALAGLARLTERLRRDAGPLWSRHGTAQSSFAKRFPAPTGWLYDTVDGMPAPYPLGGGPAYDDPVLRPNQLLAFSLPYSPLDGAVAEPVDAVGRALLTPFGLRTLAPTEYGYRGTDDHGGAAWPWLIGAYVDACRAVGRATDGLLRGLESHLGEWGLGSVSEIVDGDAPYRPGGCPFSARSVAELIRARAALR
jgi:predicted glycogen debranching enzyme